MRIRVLVLPIVLGLLAAPIVAVAPRAARADDAPPSGPAGPAPAHGGRMAYVGDRVAWFEVVHDATLGTVTVYAVEDPGRSLRLSGAPALALASSAGPRVLALERVPGSVGSWRVTDADLRAPALDARLRVRVGDKDLEGTLGPPEEPAPALPARREDRFEPTHGGQVVLLALRPFEWTHDANAGTLTVHALAGGGGPPTPPVTEARAVVDVLGGPTELRLAPVAGAAGGAWRAEDAALRSPRLEATLRLTIGGKAYEAAIATLGSHGGRLLPLGDEPSFLEVWTDPVPGTVVLYLVVPKGETFADSSTALAEPPKFRLSSAAGGRTIAFHPMEGAAGAWTATDELLRERALAGTFRVKLGGKTFEAALAAPRGDADENRGEPRSGGR